MLSILKKNKLLCGIIGAVLILILVLLIGGIVSTNREETATRDGLSFLYSLEDKDVADVESKVKAKRQEKIEAQMQTRLEELQDGTLDVWSLYDDAVVMGDSRAVGFDVFDFLPSERVIAGAGHTIRNIEEGLEQLKSLNPSTVFLCYGLNDSSIGFWESADDYAAEYQTILETLMSELPDTKFYVNSILPAQAVAIAQTSAWGNIPDWSDAVKEVCDQIGVGWVDCNDIIAAHEDLYDVDGVHMQKEFYIFWASQQWASVYQNALQEQDTDTVTTNED